jgi:hypothetical protein
MRRTPQARQRLVRHSACTTPEISAGGQSSLCSDPCCPDEFDNWAPQERLTDSSSRTGATDVLGKPRASVHNSVIWRDCDPGTSELEKRPDSANRNEPQRLMWLEIGPIIAHGQELCLSEIEQAQCLMQRRHSTCFANVHFLNRATPPVRLVLS